mmetsp:Transcript_25293/g.69685  ORF Transcript_25293/g.69685 Transcript_25293/m.69685 type:complete len:85 (+) Transcript_25293:221-475(+)
MTPSVPIETPPNRIENQGSAQSIDDVFTTNGGMLWLKRNTHRTWYRIACCKTATHGWVREPSVHLKPIRSSPLLSTLLAYNTLT